MLCAAVLMLGTAWLDSAVPACSTLYKLPDDIRKEDIAEIKVTDPSLFRVTTETAHVYGEDADRYLSIDAMKAECSSEFTLYGRDGQALLTCRVVSERRPDSSQENKLGYYQTVEVTEKEP